MLNLIEKTFKHVETAAQIISRCTETFVDHVDSNGNDSGDGSESSSDHISMTSGRGTATAAPAVTSPINSEVVQLNADNMMPLTIFLLLRAAIPHLGTEILLLEGMFKLNWIRSNFSTFL